MCMGAKPRAPRQLIEHWMSLLAAEYHVEESDAASWFYGRQTRSFAVEYLQSQGWKIEEYTTPPVGNDKVISQGFILADDCDQLVEWKLSQS